MLSNLSLTEENYLKAIFHLSEGGQDSVSTNALSEEMSTKPATVSDMVKRLSKKGLINYEKYKGSNISEKGRYIALHIIRKHRLWEVFLVDKLSFRWDEVHDIAEQLEHVKSPLLVERLDAYLGHPKVDPHGDPIPDANGEYQAGPTVKLSDLNENEEGIFVSVTNDDSRLLQYLDKVQLELGDTLKVVEINDFDHSIKINSQKGHEVFLSDQITDLLAIRKIV